LITKPVDIRVVKGPYVELSGHNDIFDLKFVINVGRKEQKSNIKTVGRFCLFQK
jgi:hypothetical protein